MVKIIDKINEHIEQGKEFFSFEYFPPKTDRAVRNLYGRISRMIQLNPSFIDITWGAGGSTSDLTIEIGKNSQTLGCTTQIHMTCTNMKKSDIIKAIQQAKDCGIQNILCLRGDPPKALEEGNEEWVQTEGGLSYAVDLVKLIREHFGDYFGICVAGYPEGHPQGSYEDDLKYLKQKVDAGADFVITQLFYDVDQFLKFVNDAREMGIKVPILPGIMPIHNYEAWKRMTTFCKTKIPDHILEDLKSVNTDDDAEMKKFGIKVCVNMIRKLFNNGVRGVHLYTLNLERSCSEILKELDLLEEVRPSLPWTVPAVEKREEESVRPIYWSNRPESYISRTSSWDEFPNGRWGASDSPAFGLLSDYNLTGMFASSKKKRTKMWGDSIGKLEDIYNVFVKFLKNEIDSIPWCHLAPNAETNQIVKELISLNSQGVLTINSQPAVNGVASDDTLHGWGPKNGFIYQKAYLEFFCSSETVDKLLKAVNDFPFLQIIGRNKSGKCVRNYGETEKPTAVTWGVFPHGEIQQPTIVDDGAFKVWTEEAFQLWEHRWGSLYSDDTSKSVFDNLSNNWFLVTIVDNNYISGNIFDIFKKAGFSFE
mmetsp:Transcript_5509/g.8141  ORF Transcript_5509/g.8141 Transcript_5509/m.8141 type:complete len:593 (-) Transcript_5509:3-1781(-)